MVAAMLLAGIYAALAVLVGMLLGEGVAWLYGRRAANRARDQDQTIIKALMAQLVIMGDTLQEVSMDSLAAAWRLGSRAV